MKGGSFHRVDRDKRDKHTAQNSDTDEVNYDVNSVVIQSFLQYQKELDAKHDKYERLIKCSRDITIESKRIIFLLHRIKNDENKSATLSDAAKRLNELQGGLLKKVAEELIKEEPHQYLRAYSAGIQEFVEAITFYFYEKDRKLVSLEEVTADLIKNTLGSNDDPAPDDTKDLRHQICQLIQPADYILGIADLTGELMRKCIMVIGAGQVDMPFELCSFLRNIHDGFVSVGNQGPREITRKLYTLKQSLTKVETACYTLQVRGSEIPKHMLVDVFTRPESHDYRDDLDGCGNDY